MYRFHGPFSSHWCRHQDEWGTYSGSYVGAGTGIAGLNGKRSGNAINLAIRWAKEVNGDRSARMTIEKIGSDGMRLTTVDTDPRTGKALSPAR